MIAASVDAAAAMPAAGSADAPALDAATVRALPPRGAPPTGGVATCRVAAADGFWTATNVRLGWRLRATFSRAEFPWLCIWTEDRLRTHAPWAGAERTRGLELSTKPFPEGAPPAERDLEFLGAPAAPMSLAEGGELVKTVVFSWARVADDEARAVDEDVAAPEAFDYAQ